jgi:anthranilate synthase/indole-3-glycerol phosphate synthase/phosphoribosylanthranilate isomerase
VYNLGADTVLLIVAMLEDSLLKSLMEYSRNLGMEPLVEVASSEEMKRALALGSKVIGVNNRDLNTFTVDMNRTNDLSPLVNAESGVILLALSGITGRKDVEKYQSSGAKGVLVGESLMKSSNTIQAVGDLLGRHTTIANVSEELSTRKPLVKICGLTNVADALYAKQCGAHLLGLIFAVGSPRQVSLSTAAEISLAVKGSSISNLRSDRFKVPPTCAKDWFSSQAHHLEIKTPSIVGVFTHQSAAEINEIAAVCHLDYIQLHTPRLASFHRLLNRPVVQVIGINQETGLEGIKKQARLYAGSCAALLLDTTTTNLVGGTGQTFDWTIISKLDFPVWMAGGLTPQNVGDAIKLNPLVVDVASGVEKSKGFKDSEKVAAFIANAV